MRSSRSCAASMAPAWFQESPSAVLGRHRGRDDEERRAVLVLDPPELGEQLLGLDGLVRDHKHAGHAPPPGGLCSRCYNRFPGSARRATRPGRRRTRRRPSTMPPIRPQTSNGKPSTPLATRTSTMRADDPEPDDPHRDLAELFFHVSSCVVDRAHAIQRHQPPALLTCRPRSSRWATIFARWSPWISITPSTTLPPDPHRRLSSRASSRRLRRRGAADRRHGLALAPRRLAPHAQDAVAGRAPGLRRGTGSGRRRPAACRSAGSFRTRPLSVE